jgi:hypothetical protein
VFQHACKMGLEGSNPRAALSHGGASHMRPLQCVVTFVYGTLAVTGYCPPRKPEARLRITHAKLSALEPGSRGKRRVTIGAELGTPNEFLNITVAVPSMGSELGVCQRGIERAKVFARQFAELSSQAFPCPDAPTAVLLRRGGT